jgi:hypothetical protein
MTDIAGLITIGVSAFAATNIDDIFVLMMKEPQFRNVSVVRSDVPVVKLVL